MIIDLKERSKEKNFCILPFIGMHIFHSGEIISPCCKLYEQPVTDKTAKEKIDDYFNSDYLNDLKQSFVSGKIPDKCKSCFVDNDNDGILYPVARGIEYRALVDKFKISSSIDVNKQNVQILNVYPNNNCNLNCRMCSPQFSSTVHKNWDTKLIQITGVPKSSADKSSPLFDNLINEIQTDDRFSELNTLIIGGGEPMMNQNLIEIFNRLDTKPIKQISVISNLTTDKFNFIDFYEKHPSPIKTLVISLDGDEAMHQYVRNGLNIENFKQNISKLKGLETVNVRFIFTPSAINFHHAVKMLEFAYKLMGDKFMVNISIVKNDFTRFNVLPKFLRYKIYNQILSDLETLDKTKFKNSDNIDAFLSTVLSELKSTLKDPYSEVRFKKFLDYIDHLDAKNQTNIHDVFPDLSIYRSIIPVKN